MRLRAVVFAVAALAPLPLQAQSVTVGIAEVGTTPPEAAPPNAGPLSLTDAVAIAMRRTPAVATAAAAVDAEAGRLQTARGEFDGLFRVAPSVFYSRTPITPFLLEREEAKRFQLRTLARGFGRVFTALERILDRTSTDPPECPDGLTDGVGGVSLERTDPTETALFGVDRDLPTFNVQLQGIPVSRLFSFNDICSRQAGTSFNPEALTALYRRVDDAGDYSLPDVNTKADAASDEIRREQREIAEAVLNRANLALARVGDLPSDVISVTGALALSYDKPFRNGLAVALDVNLSGSETNYAGKHLDPSFGNLGLATTFPSRVSASLFAPLGRGRGAAANAAEERAAGFNLVATREQLRHALASEAFRAALSYINLIAARERLALLEESQERQQRLVSLTDQRVQASDLPGMELDRARARAASVAGSVNAARQDLVEARVSFAETIGLSPDAIDHVPTAAGAFSETLPPIPNAGALLGAFGAQRHDVRALSYTRSAAAALLAGTRADLRRRFDLTVTGGVSNLYESPFFRYFPDEAYPIIAQITPNPAADSPVRALWPRGWWRSLRGRWEPFVVASVTIDVPFANNRAKGRMAQARASLRRTEIQQVELSRATGENLVAATGSLARTADAIARSRTAVERSEQTLEGTLASFDGNEATLLDTLLTEEEVTRARLELVRQRQLYASTYVRLRFEAGDLVTFEQEGTAAEQARFDPLPIVTR
jgi:outer membrane protein TolC